MSKVLLAGGAGYLGSTLVELLLAKGHTVRVFDRCFFGTSPLEEFRQHPHFELIHGDIRWPAQEVFHSVDVLIDISGLSNDCVSALNTELTLSVNRDGHIRFASLAKQSGIRQIIFSSSCSVYGQGAGLNLTEEADCKPISLYAKCKLMVEEALLNLADDTCCVTILRNSTLYGLSRRMRFDLLVNIMTARAFRENKIFIVGGGEQWRPLLHVVDAARAFVTILQSPPKKIQKQIFNVGSDNQNFQVIEIANVVNTAFPSVRFIRVPEDNDLRSYNVSFKKIREKLGFIPEHTVLESIAAIKDSLSSGAVTFNGDNDELTITLNKYIALTKASPMLELDEDEKHKVLRFVEFYKHSIDEKDILAVQQALSSVFLTTGNITQKFEVALAEYLGIKRAIGTSSCTESLFLALKALGIGEGDEVITTPATFVATVNAIEHTGAKPVFVDVEEGTGNIDAGLIARAITKHTKAILPVHLYGHMCDMKKICSVAKKYSLFVIEDAAHCIEGTRDGMRPGALSDAVCFSFYATKNITCGEGGAIATNNLKLADLLVSLRLHGLSSGAQARYAGRFRHYDMELLGYKANMSNIDAALLLGQLSRIEKLLYRKELIAHKYSAGLKEIRSIRLPSVFPDVKHARHLFTIWVNGLIRDKVITKLQERNVGVAVNYRPVHLMKYYKEKYSFRPGAFPRAEMIGDQTISLPFYPKLLDSEIEYVIDALKEIFDGQE